MIFFYVSVCLGLVFIVCMYYVTVIAWSNHVTVVICFVHIIIIIIIIIIKRWDYGLRLGLEKLGLRLTLGIPLAVLCHQTQLEAFTYVIHSYTTRYIKLYYIIM